MGLTAILKFLHFATSIFNKRSSWYIPFESKVVLYITDYHFKIVVSKYETFKNAASLSFNGFLCFCENTYSSFLEIKRKERSCIDPYILKYILKISKYSKIHILVRWNQIREPAFRNFLAVLSNVHE